MTRHYNTEALIKAYQAKGGTITIGRCYRVDHTMHRRFGGPVPEPVQTNAYLAASEYYGQDANP